MIQSRFAQHVREQNWFAVAVEFVVLVAGIFIGLQVTDWNQGRLNQKDELAYLKALQVDLQVSLEEVGSVIERLSAIQQGLLDLAGKDGASLDSRTPDELDRMVYALWDLSLLEIQMSVYEDLKSSGKLNIIGDDDIRFGLSRLETRFRRFEKSEHDVVQIQYQNIDGYLASNFPMLRLAPFSQTGRGLPEASDAELPDYADFITRIDTRNRAVMKYISLSNTLRQVSEIESSLEKLGERVEYRINELET